MSRDGDIALGNFRKEFDTKIEENIILRDYVFDVKDDLSKMLAKFKILTNKYIVVMEAGEVNGELFSNAVKTHFLTQYFLLFLYTFDRVIHVCNGKLHYDYQKQLVDSTMICVEKTGDFTDIYKTNSPLKLSLASYEGYVYDLDILVTDIKSAVKVINYLQ